MNSPTQLAAGAAEGFRLPFEGLGLLRRERRLWPPALAPVLLSLATLAAVAAGLFLHASALYAWASGWLACVVPGPTEEGRCESPFALHNTTARQVFGGGA